MQALVLEHFSADGSGVRLMTAPVPVPKDNEVRLRVHAASLNAADRHFIQGDPLLIRATIGGPRRPRRGFVLGRDVVGEVESVGSAVRDVRVGELVFGETQGTLAEWVCIRAEHVAPVPVGVDLLHMATLPVAGGTTLQGLSKHGPLQPGQRVLVTGASGGIGTMTVQLAAARGGVVTAVCRGDHADLLRRLGATTVLDAAQVDGRDRTQQWDLIIDLVGNLPLGRLRHLLAPGGTIVLTSGNGNRLLGPIPRLLQAVLLRTVTRKRLRPHLALVRRDDLLELGRQVADGTLTPVIARTYALGEAPTAIAHLLAGGVGGKLVVTMPPTG